MTASMYLNLLGVWSCEDMGFVKIMVPVATTVNNAVATLEKAVTASVTACPVLRIFWWAFRSRWFA